MRDPVEDLDEMKKRYIAQKSPWPTGGLQIEFSVRYQSVKTSLAFTISNDGYKTV